MSDAGFVSCPVNQPGIKAQIRGIRENIIRAASVAGEGHIASAFSILDILYVLYHGILRNDPQQPQDPQRDRFVLSKGHASLGIYGILAERGFFPKEELKPLRPPAADWADILIHARFPASKPPQAPSDTACRWRRAWRSA